MAESLCGIIVTACPEIYLPEQGVCDGLGVEIVGLAELRQCCHQILFCGWILSEGREHGRALAQSYGGPGSSSSQTVKVESLISISEGIFSIVKLEIDLRRHPKPQGQIRIPAERPFNLESLVNVTLGHVVLAECKIQSGDVVE